MKHFKKETYLSGVPFYKNSGGAPDLKSINGCAFFRGGRGSAPNLTYIGGRADFRDWQGSAPNLTHIGEECRDNNWKRLKQVYKQCSKSL